MESGLGEQQQVPRERGRRTFLLLSTSDSLNAFVVSKSFYYLERAVMKNVGDNVDSSPDSSIQD